MNTEKNYTLKNTWFSHQTRKTEEKINALQSEMSQNIEQIKKLHKGSKMIGNMGKKDAMLKEIETLISRNEEIAKLLTTLNTYTDQSEESIPYTPGASTYALADLIGRTPIDANRGRIVFDNYSNNDTAQIVPEGSESTPRKLNVTVLATDTNEAIIFDDIVTVGLGIYEDTPHIQDMIDHDHVNALINAENKKAFDVLVGSKNAVPVSAKNLQEAINKNLCAKAKKETMIFVNKSGFELLDVDVNGVSLVTKDSNGRFIYKNKYVIQEVNDQILPNASDGSPLAIIGDVLNVIKFFIVREDACYVDKLESYNRADRGLRKEIITLNTKSDEAFIIGKLGA